MGQLVSAPYSTDDGVEYVAYLAHVQSECWRLVDEKRLPGSDELVAFLDSAERVVQQVRRDVAGATAAGDAVVVSTIPMLPAEHARMQNMNDSLRNLLEILEMRQALELNRTPAVARVAEAIMTGTFSA
ncbi:MAG TPA: hypothetical protein VNA12_05085 [Mycobacteriales bacterium]|nr:hypothetical protein [Mycobacteriales bacterium]